MIVWVAMSALVGVFGLAVIWALRTGSEIGEGIGKLEARRELLEKMTVDEYLHLCGQKNGTARQERAEVKTAKWR